MSPNPATRTAALARKRKTSLGRNQDRKNTIRQLSDRAARGRPRLAAFDDSSTGWWRSEPPRGRALDRNGEAGPGPATVRSQSEFEARPWIFCFAAMRPPAPAHRRHVAIMAPGANGIAPRHQCGSRWGAGWLDQKLRQAQPLRGQLVNTRRRRPSRLPAAIDADVSVADVVCQNEQDVRRRLLGGRRTRKKRGTCEAEANTSALAVLRHCPSHPMLGLLFSTAAAPLSSASQSKRLVHRRDENGPRVGFSQKGDAPCPLCLGAQAAAVQAGDKDHRQGRPRLFQPELQLDA